MRDCAAALAERRVEGNALHFHVQLVVVECLVDDVRVNDVLGEGVVRDVANEPRAGGAAVLDLVGAGDGDGLGVVGVVAHYVSLSALRTSWALECAEKGRGEPRPNSPRSNVSDAVNLGEWTVDVDAAGSGVPLRPFVPLQLAGFEHSTDDADCADLPPQDGLVVRGMLPECFAGSDSFTR